jgi:hypothetical protein
MSTCPYCDYTYEIIKDLHKHLNDKHTKCFDCGIVFDNKEDNSALCDKCSNMVINKE